MGMFFDEVLSLFPLPHVQAIFKIQNVNDYLEECMKPLISTEMLLKEGALTDEGIVERYKESDKVRAFNLKEVLHPEISLKLPFDVVWMEFYKKRESSSKYGGYYDIGLLLVEHEQRILCDVFFRSPDNDILSSGYMMIWTEDNSLLFGVYKSVMPNKKDVSIYTFPVHFTASKALRGFFAVQLLNCRNVKYVENAYHLNRAARRRGERAYFEKYYTLEIGPIKKTLDEQGQAQTKGIKYALHLCRGHFKTYKEKPLLGKYTGTFWWPSMVKGSSEVGKINKDYSISMDI